MGSASTEGETALRAQLVATEHSLHAWMAEHGARVREIRRDAERIGRLEGELAALRGEIETLRAQHVEAKRRLVNAEKAYRQLRARAQRALTRDKP